MSMSESIKRDKKNVYAQSPKDHAKNAGCVAIPYDKPAHPDFVFDSAHLSRDAMLGMLWRYVEREVLPCYPLRVMERLAAK